VNLSVIHYPHPTLRHVAKPVRRVDDGLRKMINEMFGLMYQHRGIGLAATQVDLPYRLFIVNESGDPQHPELEHVFINPVLSKPKGNVEAEEGCLSLPGLYAPVKRPERVFLNAWTPAGEEINAEVEGLFARVAQHETDHLNGVLFIDRLAPSAELTIKEPLEEFERIYAGKKDRGEIPSDAAIRERLTELERERT
jgi:peptide deformylase